VRLSSTELDLLVHLMRHHEVDDPGLVLDQENHRSTIKRDGVKRRETTIRTL
jgi:hypothetical protein